MSYLDDPRVYFAAERTLLAWQRSALAFIALGFVIERFGLFVQYLNLSSSDSSIHLIISTSIGLIFILLGATISLLSALQHKRFLVNLSDHEIPPGYFLFIGPLVSLLLCIGGFLMAGWMISGFILQ
jgi:putative membrane protein